MRECAKSRQRVYDLLRGAAATDDGAWHGEYRIAALEIAKALPGTVDVLIIVVAADPVATDGLLQTLNLVPVHLDSRGDNKIVILDPLTVSRDDGVVVRHKLCHRIVHPIFMR